jgi:cytochrome c553
MAGLALTLAACTGEVLGTSSGGGSGGRPTNSGGNNGGGGNGGVAPPAEPCTGAADPRLVVAPQRFLRLTAAEYVNSIRVIINDVEGDAIMQQAALRDRLLPAVRKFPPLVGEADNIIGSEYTNLDLFADHAAKYVAANFGTATGCAVPATDACATQWLNQRAALAYRRPLTTAEQTRFTALYNKLKNQDVNGYQVTTTVEEATGFAVYALLSSPQFLWRSELGLGQTASTSPAGVPLSDLELASHLSFFLTDRPPDTMLMAAATGNTLRTNLRTHVDRLLGAQVTKDWLTTVIETNYALNQLPDITVDPGKFPEWNTELMAGMLEEANRFLKGALWGGGPLTDIFLSRRATLNALLANQIYKVPVPAGAATWFDVTLPSDQRSGILTNAAFVTARARSTGLGLVVPRGRIVVAAILCMPPNPPPDDITAVVEAAKASIATTTAQQQVASRKAGLCGTCHNQFDAYGLVLEYYDNLARYRTTDHLNMPVDGRTTLPELLGGGEVTSAIDLAEKLAASPAFTNCMATTLLQYALVDFSAPVELPALPKTAGCASADVVARFNGGTSKTFSDLVRATTSTPAFVLRQALQ